MAKSELQLLAFIHDCGKLKQLRRSGWVRRGIDRPESVADHSFRLALMSILIGRAETGGEQDLDTSKMVKMALLHDLAEISTGDITPVDGISAERKADLEANAIKDILKDVDYTGELNALCQEYLTNTTSEAKVVNELDKLEMAFQAKEYESSGNEGLEEFYTFEPDTFTNEIIKNLYELLTSDKSIKSS